jgi:hypothetical protein
MKTFIAIIIPAAIGAFAYVVLSLLILLMAKPNGQAEHHCE